MAGERILVVDDEFHLRDSIRILLEKDGYQVATAATGEDALEAMESSPAQVVISDIRMPGMDGIQLLQHIKSRYPQTEVIMLTGYPTIEAAVNAIKQGAYDYVTKPFKINTLTLTLNQALERQRLSREVGELRALLGVYEASKAITSMLDVDGVLDLVLKTIMENTSARGVALYLRDGGGEDLRLRAWEGISESEGTALRDSIEAGLGLYSQGQGKEDFFALSALTLSRERKGLCFPLRSSGKVLGVLLVLHSLAEEAVVKEARLFSIFASQSAVALENARLHQDLVRNYFETVRALVAAIDAKDPYTRGHSENVMRLSLSLADRMGMEPRQREELKLAGLLHDVGKIGIATETLRKGVALTSKDLEEIRRHPEIGARIIGNISYLADLRPAILHHHERFDGKGYPAGLKGEEIPLGARIIAIADAFDAMTNERPYRPAKSPREALGEMAMQSGSQFDPRLLEAFLACQVALASSPEGPHSS